MSLLCLTTWQQQEKAAAGADYKSKVEEEEQSSTEHQGVRQEAEGLCRCRHNTDTYHFVLTAGFDTAPSQASMAKVQKMQDYYCFRSTLSEQKIHVCEAVYTMPTVEESVSCLNGIC